MKADKTVLHSGAIDRLLKSPEVQAELKRRTDRAAAAAGKDFGSKVEVGRTRALAMAYPVTAKGERENARDHTLMRVIDTMRG